jgi:hypothetical protein
MKGTKPKTTAAPATKQPAAKTTTTTTTTPSSSGQRNPGTANKNSKDAFLKKLQLCMKTYDYKDETKDVRGKTERLNAINELQQMLSD